MRVPVYPRGSNPRTTRPIVRKSIYYAEEQVLNLLADWISPDDHSLGIIPREFLPSGKVDNSPMYAVPATPEEIEKLNHGKLRSALPPAEVGGCRFVAPSSNERNETLPHLQLENVVLAAQGWDWQMEPATA